MGTFMGVAKKYDQTISLGEKRDSEIHWINCGKLERHSGEKRQRLSFYDKGQAIEYINELISQYGLNYEDVVEVWGTPHLHKDDSYLPKRDFKDYNYHFICHLFSALIFDTDSFYHHPTL